jgi:hypothetical protein
MNMLKVLASNLTEREKNKVKTADNHHKQNGNPVNAMIKGNKIAQGK